MNLSREDLINAATALILITKSANKSTVIEMSPEAIRDALNAKDNILRAIREMQ